MQLSKRPGTPLSHQLVLEFYNIVGITLRLCKFSIEREKGRKEQNCLTPRHIKYFVTGSNSTGEFSFFLKFKKIEMKPKFYPV